MAHGMVELVRARHMQSSGTRVGGTPEAAGHCRGRKLHREVVGLPQPETAQSREARHAGRCRHRRPGHRIADAHAVGSLQRTLRCNLQPS